MIIEYLKGIFSPKFFDSNGKEVHYIKYFPKTGMILVERNGQELIPISGLRKGC